MCSILAAVAVCFSTVAISSRPASASSIASDKAQAATLYRQINRINARVDALGQKYDEVKIKLDHIEDQIKNTKAYVAKIKRNVSKGVAELRSDAIFAYVTNGSALSSNPLFNSNANKASATNVYNQLAEGNVGTALAGLKTYRVELTQERSILSGEHAQATAATHAAANAFHEAKLLQSGLHRTLGRVKGQIANFIAATEAAAAARNASTTSRAAASAAVTTGVQHLFKAVYAGGVPQQTLELVHLRASQVNGCSACVDAGVKSATKAGVSSEKLLTVAAWYENPLFDDAERAALALAEAATRLSDRPGAVTDEIWAEAARHYDERQLAALVLMVAITNFFNRLNTTLRVPAGTAWD